MVRGIERTALFRDDADRADFMARLDWMERLGKFWGWTSFAFGTGRWRRSSPA
jgi:hypothetical protein